MYIGYESANRRYVVIEVEERECVACMTTRIGRQNNNIDITIIIIIMRDVILGGNPLSHVLSHSLGYPSVSARKSVLVGIESITVSAFKASSGTPDEQFK